MAVLEGGNGETGVGGRSPSAGSGWRTAAQLFALILAFAALTFLPALAVIVTTRWLKQGNAYQPEIVLPVVLIVGLISLLAVLTSLVAVYRRFDLLDDKSALGLPAGSIQAVIALSLILIFAIVGVYLTGLSSQTTERTTTGLTRAQVDALPQNTIVRIHLRADGRFDVTRAVPTETPQQDDISKQLLTTVSTLVVAVAGFYFGSKSVKEAREAVAGRREDDGTTGDGSDTGGGGGDAGGGDGSATTGTTSSTDETSAYGDQSPVTGLSADDVEAELGGAPLSEVDAGDPQAGEVDDADDADAAETTPDAAGTGTQHPPADDEEPGGQR